MDERACLLALTHSQSAVRDNLATALHNWGTFWDSMAMTAGLDAALSPLCGLLRGDPRLWDGVDDSFIEFQLRLLVDNCMSDVASLRISSNFPEQSMRSAGDCVALLRLYVDQWSSRASTRSHDWTTNALAAFHGPTGIAARILRRQSSQLCTHHGIRSNVTACKSAYTRRKPD